MDPIDGVISIPKEAKGDRRPRKDQGEGSRAAHEKKRPRKEKDEREEEELVMKIHHNAGKFMRGAPLATKGIEDKKLKRQMKDKETRYKSAVESAAAAELLLTEDAGYLEAEGPMEKTYKFSQSAIAKAVDVAVAKKSVELTLDTYGPYHLAYTRSGRHMLLAGEKGHVAVVDWNKFTVTAEMQLREQVHDVTFLHTEQLFAVAQKKYAYIYDHTGAEVHVLRNHLQPLALDFLPYHFLLASVGNSGFLKYQDVSTGQLVAEHRTKLGPTSVLRHNPWNAVMHLGHSNGTVTMWTPNMNTPVVKMGCHKGGVTALAVDAGGRYMVTAGLDARLKVWDVRNFKQVHDYFTIAPARSVDISQRGMVGVGFGSHVQIWGKDFALEGSKAVTLTSPVILPSGDEFISAGTAIKLPGTGAGAGRDEDSIYGDVRKAKAPYLRHELPGRTVTSLRFRPFDDVCAIGHSNGLASILVPGAGEPNYDSQEFGANPYAGKKARREGEVHALLDKLSPSMISLDPSAIGKVDRAAPAIREREKAEAAAAALTDAQARKREKRRHKAGIRKALKKNANIITAQRVAMMEKIAKEKADKEAAKEAEKKAAAGAGAGAGEEERKKSALSRFYEKREK